MRTVDAMNDTKNISDTLRARQMNLNPFLPPLLDPFLKRPE